MEWVRLVLVLSKFKLAIGSLHIWLMIVWIKNVRMRTVYCSSGAPLLRKARGDIPGKSLSQWSTSTRIIAL